MWIDQEPTDFGVAILAGRGSESLLRADPLVTLIDGDGEHALMPLQVTGDRAELNLFGGNPNWALSGTLKTEPTLPGLIRLDIQLEYLGVGPSWMTAQVRCELLDAGVPSWLVPGVFYGNGPAPGYVGDPYPTFDHTGGDPDRLVSNHWAFRMDRASHPAVLGWTNRACLGMATVPRFGDDQAGVEFEADGQRAWLALNFPWRELPRRYTLIPSPSIYAPSTIRTRAVQQGEIVSLSAWWYLAEPDQHAFDPLLRWLYHRHDATSPLNPWFDRDTAASLAAGGIVRWHANPTQRLLYETVWFEAQPGRPRLDRRQQHVGWVSGVPTALALARHARTVGHPAVEQIALDVIDRIAHEAPGKDGLLWADWSDDRGWGVGWSPRPDWIQARTIAEATLFLLRATREEAALGRDRPAWRTTALRSLDVAVRTQRADGNFGAFYDVANAHVAEWSGSAGLLWIAALLEGWRDTADSRYLDAARRGGAYYAPQVESNTLHGAPEDASFTPSSEDGYNALIAYMALFHTDATESERWLRLARLAADWTMTFRFAYNVDFSPLTELGALRFASRGADIASPRNSHLHSYGLICLRELLELWEQTHDPHYLLRARDLLLCFWQTIARFDGEFGAGQGMMTERWYQTDWIAPQGGMLPLSHVWCLGMVLHGWWTIREYGDLVIYGRSGRAVLLAPGQVDQPRPTEVGLAYSISNPLDSPLTLRVRILDLDPLAATLNGESLPVERVGQVRFVTCTVPAAHSATLELRPRA